jgi:hypothetical protein
MVFEIGTGEMPIIQMDMLIYSGTDIETIAAIECFNMFFSITFQFGVLAMMCTIIVAMLSRS